jgi:hypothetical protein
MASIKTRDPPALTQGGEGDGNHFYNLFEALAGHSQGLGFFEMKFPLMVPPRFFQPPYSPWIYEKTVKSSSTPGTTVSLNKDQTSLPIW